MQTTTRINTTGGDLSTSKLRIPLDIRKDIGKDPEKKRLYEAALEFQSIFLNMMLKSMRKTLKPEKGLLFGGRTEEIFTDMLYDERAKVMSRSGSYGLAESIYRQMAPNVGGSAAKGGRDAKAALEYARNVTRPTPRQK